ncbi:MAG: hypothetical protein A2Y03_10990 [Omnitrophica WOR_2 bacterium GWF2_38_59]|nr:MAG: hypothetical protein A2Y06_00650 [Omnitrophica WOR_2 bacterium GWA2_37_7]OGX25207.1 MAG: hypothetical protein A2Y03_10990 [Omnitrophica WOR_2 bacterium GWF2_38_59]OGX47879.1 MAG: hypothetical protein A2243_00845 [Omnitrophica WOR_2 bacterium RIFOXYA2_FULL_38_17]OGX53553.1 MAG: hypothetical protein A2267_04285 [Omnitrophica WOR_2 bacterium RIFOXYA12_FULL_38_10]OGX56216.1 MAG: hypothetical protein A2447_08165 [Omnitrophica WOR_2 bacterium RIFOXYC2_FULL_38_12]OGX60279.1 MAG: hypothetical 
MENRIFYYALVISLVIHIVVINLLSFSRVVLKEPKLIKQLEVTYNKVTPKHDVVEKKLAKSIKSIKEQKKTKKVDILSKDEKVLPSFSQNIKDMTKLTGKLKLDKKRAPMIQTSDMNRQISVPMFKSEKISNPKYLSYNQSIRQKIKSRAYTFVNHPDFSAGEIYLTFVLGSDGALKQVKIIESKTKANEYLRDIGLRSISESAPFAPFPEDLNYPELTFNIVISFEVGE